jgi:hypothetical protein
MTQCYVLKKQFVMTAEMDKWVEFLNKYETECYNILTFKNTTPLPPLKKIRVRFYFNIMKFMMEEKEIINLSYGFIPSQWRLLKEIKKTCEIENFSKFLGKNLKDQCKTRKNYIISADLKCNLDVPSNTLEIKSLSLLKLYHFILENSELFNIVSLPCKTDGKYLVDHD